MTELSSLDIAVLHGNYFQNGGGERVATEIARTFDAPLYYGYGDRDVIPDDDVTRRKLFNPNPLSKIVLKRISQYRDIKYMWHSLHLPELFEYDVVIQSGNEFGWYVPRQLDQVIVKYVHSPPRGPYDMHYKHGGEALHRLYGLAVKTLYRHTTSYPDQYVANSEVVQRRCRKAWDVDSKVIYPPVDTGLYGPENAFEQRSDIYLTLSRLYRHKRTREIVEAFRDLDSRLIVCGDGPQRGYLERIAPENVEIWGYVSEEVKQSLLAECRAFIFNAENEDFGLVPVEAMASGTPVIGIRDGFTRYQIQDGVNGVLYPRGAASDIRNAVVRFRDMDLEWGPEELMDFARQFDVEVFRERMREVVREAVRDASVEPRSFTREGMEDEP